MSWVLKECLLAYRIGKDRLGPLYVLHSILPLRGSQKNSLRKETLAKKAIKYPFLGVSRWLCMTAMLQNVCMRCLWLCLSKTLFTRSPFHTTTPRCLFSLAWLVYDGVYKMSNCVVYIERLSQSTAWLWIFRLFVQCSGSIVRERRHILLRIRVLEVSVIFICHRSNAWP